MTCSVDCVRLSSGAWNIAKEASPRLVTAALATASFAVSVPSSSVAAGSGIGSLIGDTVARFCCDYVCCHERGVFREMGISAVTTTGGLLGAILALPGGFSGSVQTWPLIIGTATACATTSLYLQVEEKNRQQTATAPQTQQMT